MGNWLRAARLFLGACLGRDDPPVGQPVPLPSPPSLDDLPQHRPNVGVVLFNRAGQVWLGRRAGAPPPLCWQFPQGGVDKGEDLLAAARRELREETGVRSIAYLGCTEGWIAYDFPEGWRGSKAMKGWLGQKQVWFAFRFEGEDAEVDLAAHPPIEFEEWRWGTLEEAPALVVEFKQETYRQVVAAFARFSGAAAA